MDISFQRNVDRFLGNFLCRLLSLIHRTEKEPTSVPPRKILVILLSEMGSLVLAHPMFEHIKKNFPEASIHILVFKTNKEMVEILSLVPTQHVHTLDEKAIVPFANDCFQTILKLRKMRFDVVIDCELFARISSLFAYLSGAPIRVGFHPYTQEGLYRGNFINRPVLYNPYRHISQQFVTLSEAINSKTMPLAKKLSERRLPMKSPTVHLRDDEISKTKKRLTADFGRGVDKPWVLIYPSGGLLPIRAWPLENYSRLAKELINRGCTIGVIGLKEDKELAEEILSYCDSQECIDLTGYTRTIRELMALFHLSSLLITHDGGPAQFAAMTPIPSIILFGPETPLLYRPLDQKAKILHVPLSCSPCLTAYNHRNSPCDGNNLCLQAIDCDRVLSEALDVLEP